MSSREKEASGWDSRLSKLQDDSQARSVERFYAQLTLGRQEDSVDDFIEELMERSALSASTRAHLRTQDPARLLLYRGLVRSTFQKTLENAMPRALARLEEQFTVIFDDFLATRATDGRCLRDVIPSFLKFVKEDAPFSVPAYIWELAELEALRISVASAATKVKGVSTMALEPQLDRGLLFSESTVLLSFDHAVHLLSEAEEDRKLPEEKVTHLLAYRDADNDVRYMELSPMASTALQSLMGGAALGAAILKSCKEEAQEASPDLLSGFATVLSDLAERGAILGVSEEKTDADVNAP